MRIQDITTKELEEACWKNYKQIGMKKKGGKQVPNCVPKESVDISEAPLDFDPAEPMASTIHSHQGVNPASVEVRIMRARRQLKDLARQAESDDPAVWAQIARLFPELAMNIEQVAHGVGELGKIKKQGGTRSRNIPKGI